MPIKSQEIVKYEFTRKAVYGSQDRDRLIALGPRPAELDTITPPSRVMSCCERN